MPRLRWDGSALVEEPLHHESVRAADARPVAPVALHDVHDIRQTGIAGTGELATSVSARDTRDAMARQILDSTDGSPAARRWAEEKADRACRTWDRGVRNGSITRPT